MKKLNLKKFDLKIKIKDNKRLIFDCIRNSYFHLTKEEWVRQNVIQTLINEYDIPKSKISVEKGFKINSLNKRFDIVAFNSENKINLLVECKSYDVQINQKTIDQILIYNKEIKSEFLFVTNGLKHIFLKFDNNIPIIIDNLPDYYSL